MDVSPATLLSPDSGETQQVLVTTQPSAHEGPLVSSYLHRTQWLTMLSLRLGQIKNTPWELCWAFYYGTVHPMCRGSRQAWEREISHRVEIRGVWGWRFHPVYVRMCAEQQVVSARMMLNSLGLNTFRTVFVNYHIPVCTWVLARWAVSIPLHMEDTEFIEASIMVKKLTDALVCLSLNTLIFIFIWFWDRVSLCSSG